MVIQGQVLRDLRRLTRMEMTRTRTPCTMRLVQVSLFCGTLCFPVYGIAQPIYVLGVGADSCSSFISHIVAPPGKSISRTAPDDGRDYYSKSTTYFEWLLGFVTGYNAAVNDTGKQIQLDPAAVDVYVRSWCAQNPTSNIFTAAHQFLNKADP